MFKFARVFGKGIAAQAKVVSMNQFKKMSTLQPKDISIITATVPILEAGGEALIKHFYGIMLNDYPEVKPFFNQTHQKSGDQPRALARAVLMYAKNIDKLHNLGPLVGQIVHKHTSLNINLDHYPIVGACLIRAIKEVLGPQTATPEVIEAWTNAYNMLANILIGAEGKVYEDRKKAEGGWKGARSFIVTNKHQETDNITSFYLKPQDGKPVMNFTPGQYIGLDVFINGQEYRRNYSLSRCLQDNQYRISVKREPQGVISNHLHDIKVGSVIDLFPPSGEFIIRNVNVPIVMICAGVGITPMIAMLQSLLSQPREIQQPVHFIQCVRTPQEQPFKEFIEKIGNVNKNFKYFYCYSQGDSSMNSNNVSYGKRLNQDMIRQWLPSNNTDNNNNDITIVNTNSSTEVYFLGPKGFMLDMKTHLKNLKIPEDKTYYEFFGPTQF